MGLITKEVKMTWTNRNKAYYINKGYPYTKNGDIFIVKVEDLLKSSDLKINVECDCPDCRNSYLPPMRYEKYIKYIREDGKYYCENCVKKYKVKNNKSFEQWCIDNNYKDILNRWDYELNNNIKPSEITFSTSKKYYFKCPRGLHDSELKNISYFTSGNMFSIKCKECESFNQWCIDNNRQDVLERWDYELNGCKPNDIFHGITNKYYFKCPKGIHKSELKDVRSFIKGYNGSLDCKTCNSFAQWGIDNLGKDFLEKYWDYEKNTVDPWEISYGNNNFVFIKCQEKDYHSSYPIKCNNFINGIRCGYCNNKKVHPLDSLGKLLEDKGLLHLWSDKNEKSPYKYPPHNDQQVYWKCPEGKHEDYPRSINASNQRDFRCPNCLYSKGENKIDNILTQINIFHDYQFSFDNLRGANRKLLRFDTPIFWDKEKTKLKLIIEYDGESHFRPVCFGGISMERATENFKKQVENDIKKNLYCAKNNIQLIRIPYWEYDNIEEILRYYLIENNEFDY